MVEEKSAGKKIPIWVWIVGGLLLLGLAVQALGGNGSEEPEALVEEPSEVSQSETEEPVTEEEPVSSDADFAIATVKERYETDCFLNIGADPQYRYEAEPGGTMREGFVFVSVGGEVLQFAVGINDNSGNFLTFPFNQFTDDLLWEKCSDLQETEPVE